MRPSAERNMARPLTHNPFQILPPLSKVRWFELHHSDVVKSRLMDADAFVKSLKSAGRGDVVDHAGTEQIGVLLTVGLAACSKPVSAR